MDRRSHAAGWLRFVFRPRTDRWGRSSAEDVEALMGPAPERRAGAAGESVFYYSRLPKGGQTYAARIGPAGKLVALEQRLAPEYIARIAPGPLILGAGSRYEIVDVRYE